MASLARAFVPLILAIFGSFLMEDYHAYKTAITLILYSSVMTVWYHSSIEVVSNEASSMRKLLAKKGNILSDLEKQAKTDKAQIESLEAQTIDLRLEKFFAYHNARADIKKEIEQQRPHDCWPRASGDMFTAQHPADKPSEEPEQVKEVQSNAEKDDLLKQIATLKEELSDVMIKKEVHTQCPQEEKQTEDRPKLTDPDISNIKAEVEQHVQLLRNEKEEMGQKYKAEAGMLQDCINHYSVAFKEAHALNAQYEGKLVALSAEYEDRLASLTSLSIYKDEENARLKDRLFYRRFFSRNQKSKKQKAETSIKELEASVEDLLKNNAEHAKLVQKLTADDHRRKLAWNELQARWRKYRGESEESSAKQTEAYTKASEVLQARHRKLCRDLEARHKKDVEDLEKKHNDAMRDLVSSHAASRLTRIQDDGNLTDQQREYIKRIEDRNEDFKKNWQNARQLQRQVEEAVKEKQKLEETNGMLGRRIDLLNKELSDEKAKRLISMPVDG